MIAEARNDIVDLETEIDALTEAAERCRKIMVVAKVAVAAGSLTLLALIFGLLRGDPMALLAAVTACLAGIAVFGSHRSTLQEIIVKVAAREARRNALIDSIELRPVDNH